MEFGLYDHRCHLRFARKLGVDKIILLDFASLLAYVKPGVSVASEMVRDESIRLCWRCGEGSIAILRLATMNHP